MLKCFSLCFFGHTPEGEYNEQSPWWQLWLRYASVSAGWTFGWLIVSLHAAPTLLLVTYISIVCCLWHSLCQSQALLQLCWDSAGCGLLRLTRISLNRSRRTAHSESPEKEQTWQFQESLLTTADFMNFYKWLQLLAAAGSHLSDRSGDLRSSWASDHHLNFVIFIEDDRWTHGRHWPFSFQRKIVVASVNKV